MIKEVIVWGLKPKTVTGDTWYSSQENLKFLRNQKLGFLMGIAKNRKVSVQPGVYTQVQELPIPDNGLVVHLNNFGKVKVFRKTFKNEVERYYIMFLPCLEELEYLTRYDFKQMHSIHWGIECYHRAIKQLCGIERFMVRTTDALNLS
jgi:hypothetical protein